MLKRVFVLFAVLCLCPLTCAAEEAFDEEKVYTLYTEEGEKLTSRCGRMYADDEYISGDNGYYRIISVDDENCAAYARYLGQAEAELSGPDDWRNKLDGLFEAKAEDGKGLICMYSTHSDESYVDGDGESSKIKNAGIYDVGGEFKNELEKLGYTVIYSDETFHPHDAGAYSRSASTAEEFVKKSPEAIFDIHRDGIAADEYETEVDGRDMSMVRLFVGRSNANSAANKAFAREIKAVADEKYPGLIKDIYIGKGNYNQELYPQALLLEFGTHEIDKELVMESTGYMAEVVDNVISGGSAQAAEADAEKNEGAGRTVIWVIVIAAAAALIYALAATGRMGGMWDKFKRSISELTGGSAGKRK